MSSISGKSWENIAFETTVSVSQPYVWYVNGNDLPVWL